MPITITGGESRAISQHCRRQLGIHTRTCKPIIRQHSNTIVYFGAALNWSPVIKLHYDVDEKWQYSTWANAAHCPAHCQGTYARFQVIPSSIVLLYKYVLILEYTLWLFKGLYDFVLCIDDCINIVNSRWVLLIADIPTGSSVQLLPLALRYFVWGVRVHCARVKFQWFIKMFQRRSVSNANLLTRRYIVVDCCEQWPIVHHYEYIDRWIVAPMDWSAIISGACCIRTFITWFYVHFCTWMPLLPHEFNVTAWNASDFENIR